MIYNQRYIHPLFSKGKKKKKRNKTKTYLCTKRRRACLIVFSQLSFVFSPFYLLFFFLSIMIWYKRENVSTATSSCPPRTIADTRYNPSYSYERRAGVNRRRCSRERSWIGEPIVWMVVVLPTWNRQDCRHHDPRHGSAPTAWAGTSRSRWHGTGRTERRRAVVPLLASSTPQR